MANLKYLIRSPSIKEEREFERSHIANRREWYFRTNPLDRMKKDPAYEQKVNLIKDHLIRTESLILDIGGNVAGEAIILQQLGWKVLVGDINDIALGVSRERCKRFNLKQPNYIALDVHNLPLTNESFSVVTVIEALHHFYSYEKALSEIYRILKPGGKLVSLEPNGWDPIRRFSEIRDRFRGTIEKSFYPTQLKRLCREVGFSDVRIQSIAHGRSCSKLEHLPSYRKRISRLYGWFTQNYPTVFGNLLIEAYKPM
jgi:SAM-dependent methyltransferase